MLKIGLEQEFFVRSGDGYLEVPVPKIFTNPDESGVLAEARGKPHTDVLEAVFSLKADIARLERLCYHTQYVLVDVPLMMVTRQHRQRLAREFAKGLNKEENLYGYTAHRNKILEWTAGIHISFTRPRVILVEGKTAEYNAMFDYVSLFRALDKAFAAEIHTAKRNPGFYELKDDGRIEYRSLPTSASHTKIVDVLTELLKKY